MNSKLTTGLFVAGVAVIGAAAGSLVSTLPTSAASTGSGGTASATTAASTSTQPQGGFDPAKGGHIGANGKMEELLTGDEAEKAKAAALAAVSGGTIIRVETDAEGATYEAHMTKSDGTQVTVKMDGNFKVTGTETGGPGGPQGSSSSSSSTNTN
jgi:predicted enzyme related to lactoylglutathione lyase